MGHRQARCPVSDRLFDDEDTTPWLPPLEPETEAFDDDTPTIPDPRRAERMAELIARKRVLGKR